MPHSGGSLALWYPWSVIGAGVGVSVSLYMFGSFELDPVRLELRRDGVRLDVGSRACRVLLVLVQRAGRVVSQAELLAAAWPGLHVEDVNLRVHIVALRKALSREIDITTVPREGYVFASSVCVVGPAEMSSPSLATVQLPRRLSPLIGRRDALDQLGDTLAAHRLVTIAGAGGIGKTALALAAVAERSGTECVFIDFSTSVSSLHVRGRIFDALGLEGAPSDLAGHIVRALSPRTILLVFDNCEHVVGDVAAMAVALMDGTKGVSILATSREPLRIAGERVFALQPLTCPPENPALTAEAAMHYPAIEMFVETAGLRSKSFVIDDGNACLLGEICRKLDGIPLAIELAAAMSDTMTIGELARHIDDRFAVLTQGARTALPRHRTLQAALDWSYDALNESEAAVMRRLGVFPGRFTAVDAREIAELGARSDISIHTRLADLVSKSLLTVDLRDEVASFRFLETMRVYARLKLLESDEAAAAYTRFVDNTLSRIAKAKRHAGIEDGKRSHTAILDDWRAAHDWTIRTQDWRMALALMEAGSCFCQSLNIRVEYVERASTTLRSIPSKMVEDEALRSEMHVCNEAAQILIDMDQSTSSIERTQTLAERSLLCPGGWKRWIIR